MARIDVEILADQAALNRFRLRRAKGSVYRQPAAGCFASAPFSVPPFVRRDAENRIQENCAFIESTFVDFGLRLAAYRHAIDQTVLETPPAGTNVIDNSLIELGQRAAMWRRELLRPCKVVEEVMCDGTARPYK